MQQVSWDISAECCKDILCYSLKEAPVFDACCQDHAHDQTLVLLITRQFSRSSLSIHQISPNNDTDKHQAATPSRKFFTTMCVPVKLAVWSSKTGSMVPSIMTSIEYVHFK